MRIWTIIGCTLLISAAACKKAANTAGSGGGGPTKTTGVDSTYNPVDPPLAATIGFFGDSWTARNLSLPGDTNVAPTALAVTDSLTINRDNVIVKTPPYLFGNNSNLWMGQIVTQAIDAIIQKGEADFFREFAYDVPALVLFKLVGVPDADVPKVKSWGVSRSLLTWGSLSDQEQVPHAHNMVEYWRYCQDLVRQRREHEGDDLPTDLLRDQKSGGKISDDEIAGVLYSVLFAGHETTTTLMANGVRELLAHRDNWEALIADPSLIPSAVDEVLRYAPSIVAWRRKALKDTSIAGVALPQGSNILLLLGSANRDQTVFADAQHFDVQRKDARKHLAFGYGIHTCVGQQLAKIEFTIALEELARRMPGLRLKPGQKFEFAHNSSFRVLTALHVEWKAA